MNDSPLARFIALAQEGTRASVDALMSNLRPEISIAESKFIDFALSQIATAEGAEAMEHHLFFGTQIQRNYCARYFARLGQYPLLRKAYEEGLIDAVQAFSR